MLKVRIAGENIVKFDTAAGFSHHGFHGIAPFFVMGGVLVFGVVFDRTVNFHKFKFCRVFLLLDDVEPSDAGLFDAVGGIFNRSGFEGFDLIFFHMNENMNNEHGIKTPSSGCS